MKDFEREDDFSDIEDALMRMRPIELSEQFYASVETELNENADERVPARNALSFFARGRSLAFIHRVSASAALFFCALALGLWGYFALPNGLVEKGKIPEFESAVAATTTGVTMAAAHGKRGESSRNSRARSGSFNLVNVERRMNSVKPLEVVANSDGTISRKVRYSYLDEFRWEDESAAAAYVELRPHEEIICMEMPVY